YRSNARNRILASAEQPPNAAQEIAACSGEQRLWCVPTDFESGQRARIRHNVATHTHRDIIAAVLTLDSNLPRHPPRARMVEEQRLGDPLETVDEEIVPLDVRELVSQHRLHLLPTQAQTCGRAHEHDRPKPADHARNINEPGEPEPDVTVDPQLSL